MEIEIHRIFELSPMEIQALSRNPATPGLTAALASMLIKAINTGDPKYLGYLRECTIGPIQRNVKIEMPDDSDEREKKERLKKLEAENEAIIEMLKANGGKGIT
jgi:hypothetical protein